MIKSSADTLNRLEVLSKLISGYKLMKEKFTFLSGDGMLKHYEKFTDNKNLLDITTEYIVSKPQEFISVLETKGIKVKHRKSLDYNKAKSILQHTDLNPELIVVKFNNITCEIRIYAGMKVHVFIYDKDKNTLEFRLDCIDYNKHFLFSKYEDIIIEYDQMTNSPNKVIGEGFIIHRDDYESSYYKDNASDDIKYLFINDNCRKPFDKILDYIFTTVDNKHNLKAMYKVADIAVEVLKEKTIFDV